MVFGKLLSRFKTGAAQESSTPEGTRLYVVGDIHGRDDLLSSLMGDIEQDGLLYPDRRKILLFLGDYVDRGLQSRQVIERLCGPMPDGFEAVFLKGNHELAMLQFLGDAQFGRTWKYYGGLETLHSYGINEMMLTDDPRDFDLARARLAEEMPEHHKDFLMKLELSTEFGDYYFAHAGVRPGIALDHQVEDDLLWIRDDFLRSRASFGKIVVHGHTPSEDVVFRSNRIGVDTGAYMTGVLTCLVLDGTERGLLQTGEQMARAVGAD